MIWWVSLGKSHLVLGCGCWGVNDLGKEGRVHSLRYLLHDWATHIWGHEWHTTNLTLQQVHGELAIVVLLWGSNATWLNHIDQGNPIVGEWSYCNRGGTSSGVTWTLTKYLVIRWRSLSMCLRRPTLGGPRCSWDARNLVEDNSPSRPFHAHITLSGSWLSDLM